MFKHILNLLKTVFDLLFMKTKSSKALSQNIDQNHRHTPRNIEYVSKPMSNLKTASKHESEIGLELWIDDPLSLLLSKTYWDEIQYLNFTAASIMIETSRKGFDLKFDYKSLEKIGNLAQDRNINLGLTTWPNPNKKDIKALERGVVGAIDSSGATSLEGDLEFNWTKSKIEDFASYKEASKFLLDSLFKVKEKTNVLLEVTTFPYHRENLETAQVASEVDRLVVQAYGVRNRNGKIIDLNHTYGPYKMVEHTLERTIQIPGVKDNKVQVGVGLAAYDQSGWAILPKEAMKIAYDSVEKVSYIKPTLRRYWSSKHILGIKKKEYSNKFFANKEYLNE